MGVDRKIQLFRVLPYNLQQKNIQFMTKGKNLFEFQE